MDRPIEFIPDDDPVYHRIHKTYIQADGISPNAFANSPKKGPAMSVDWAKYASPAETRARAPKPTENAVVQFVAGEVRQVPGQKVEHSPDASQNNRAHADVVGQKTTEVRTHLSRIWKPAIPLEQASPGPHPP